MGMICFLWAVGGIGCLVMTTTTWLLHHLPIKGEVAFGFVLSAIMILLPLWLLLCQKYGNKEENR